MGKKLTEDMIKDKSNIDDISTLIDLNFWASELEDVSILNDMPNVETVSLSLNKIMSLSFFKNCTNLKELFLRKNKIENLKEVNHLRSLPNLKVLWLWDNPLSSHPHYRLYIIKMLPRLQKLDNAAVSQEERLAAKKLDPNIFDNEESEIADQDDDMDENKKTNESYLKNHNIVKRDQIRKPHSGIGSAGYNRPKFQKATTSQSQRNDNILTAILTLMKELDKNSLEVVQKEVEKKMNEM